MVKRPLRKWRKSFRKHYSKFVYCDAGRWQAMLEEGKTTSTTVRLKQVDWLKSYASKSTTATSEKMREVGDCAIRATALACGVSYKEVKRIAHRHGWSKYIGWCYFERFLETRTTFGTTFSYVRTWGRGKTTTVIQFLNRYPVGEYVLMVKDFSHKGCHTFLVRDGRVYDTFFEDSWVTSAYKVNKPLDKSANK